MTWYVAYGKGRLLQPVKFGGPKGSGWTIQQFEDEPRALEFAKMKVQNQEQVMVGEVDTGAPARYNTEDVARLLKD